MRRKNPVLSAVLVLGITALLAIVACEGGKSPTAPEIPSVQSAPAVAPAEAPASSASAAGEQPGDEEVAVAEARQAKVDICHRTGNGSFHLISVGAPAVEAHLAHGDTLAGTGGLDENCEPAGTPGPTETATATPTAAVETGTPTPTATGTTTGEPSSTPTGTPTNSPIAPTDTPIPPTDTPTNTPTAAPTDTSTNTPTTEPSSTPTATSTATSIPTATSTPTTTQVAICHLLGSGSFQLTFVDSPSVNAHLGHGDVFPGTSGLDQNCNPAG